MRQFLQRYGLVLTIFFAGLAIMAWGTTARSVEKDYGYIEGWGGLTAQVEGEAAQAEEQEVIAVFVQTFLCTEDKALEMARAWMTSEAKLREVISSVVPGRDCTPVMRAPVQFPATRVVLGPVVDYEGDEFFVMEVGGLDGPRRFGLTWSIGAMQWAPGEEPASAVPSGQPS